MLTYFHSSLGITVCVCEYLLIISKCVQLVDLLLLLTELTRQCFKWGALLVAASTKSTFVDYGDLSMNLRKLDSLINIVFSMCPDWQDAFSNIHQFEPGRFSSGVIWEDDNDHQITIIHLQWLINQAFLYVCWIFCV